MTEKKDHTLIPWDVWGSTKSGRKDKVCKGGVLIADCWTSDRSKEETEENAAYIVRACNSFPALVAALQEAEVSLFDGDDRQRKTWKTVADALESIGEL
jgi:hypothetical protein